MLNQKHARQGLIVLAIAAALVLGGCSSTPQVDDAASGPVAMAGPEENWANFSGAVDRDRSDVVEFMVRQGINPNMIVKGGDPALVRAIRMESWSVVETLLNAPGIDVDTASEYGETALMLAAFKGNMKLVQTLLDKGASVNRVGGWTPLHYAATQGHDDIVKLLIEKGARVNVQTAAGVTPLYMAARKPSRQVVMTLLKAGAWRDLCNDKNQSPADAALKAGDEELATFLKVEKCAAPLTPYTKAVPAAARAKAQPSRAAQSVPSAK